MKKRIISLSAIFLLLFNAMLGFQVTKARAASGPVLSYSYLAPEGAGIDGQRYDYSYQVTNNTFSTIELIEVGVNFSQFYNNYCQYDYIPGSLASSHMIMVSDQNTPGYLPIVSYNNRVALEPGQDYKISFSMILRANPEDPSTECYVTTLFTEHEQTAPIEKSYDHTIVSKHVFAYRPTPEPAPTPGGSTGSGGSTGGTTGTATESEQLIVLPAEWLTEGSSTTRLDNMTREELASVENPTFEHLGKNKITFIGTFDLSSDEAIAQMNRLGEALNLSTAALITTDRAEIPSLGEKAMIAMYSLGHKDIPTLLIDGVEATSGEAMNFKYDPDTGNGTLSFEVTSLSNLYQVVQGEADLILTNDSENSEKETNPGFLEENWGYLTAGLLLLGGALILFFAWKKRKKSEKPNVKKVVTEKSQVKSKSAITPQKLKKTRK